MTLPRIPDQVVESARDRIVEVIAAYIDLDKRGADLWGRCPFHDENSSSFRVSEAHRNFRCWGCGARGDAIEFIQQIEHLNMPDAIRRITGSETFDAASLPPRTHKPPPPPKFEPLPVAPKPASAVKHPQLGSPDSLYTYYNADGEVIGYVARFDFEGGRKDVIPYTWARTTSTGKEGWQWVGFAKPRPLYGLDILAQRPEAPVIVVEGEKAADACRDLAPWAVVVSWPGGGGGIAHVDWTPLEGRRVLLWPDADPPGLKTMAGYEDDRGAWRDGIADLARPFAADLSILAPPDDAPKGWDAADAVADGWTVARLRVYVREAARLVFVDGEPVDRDEDEAEADEAAPDRGADHDEIAAGLAAADYLDIPDLDEDGGEPPPAENLRDESGAPFRVLGYYRDEFYFLGYRSKQIRSFSSRAMSDNAMMELAPLQWWERTFPKAKGGLDTKAAVNWMIDSAYRRGVYDPRHVRGRGAWRDAGRVVFHFGDALSVNGETVDVLDVESRYVYQIERRLAHPADQALTDEEAQQILDTAELFGWNKAASAAMLTGWLALAPICGALRWRPHIWLTGNAGCGKSTILEQFAGWLLGPLALKVQGASTEAGIRQTLGTDAIPVLFDETEQNDKREQQRMQSVITMIRQASTESGMQTLRGTVSGDAVTYHIRSMFALASIQVGIRHQADFERLSVLPLRSVKDGSMRADEAAAVWEAAKTAIAGLHADRSFPARFFRRVLDLAPVTLRNIETFTKAAAIFFGTQRDGDQYGTMLAGAYSLSHGGLATEAEARAWLDRYDWSEVYDLAEGDQSRKALYALLGAMIRDDKNNAMTIGEAVAGVRRGPMWESEESNAADEKNKILMRYGLRVSGVSLFIANENINRSKLLEDTPYAADLVGLLKRLPGAAFGRQIKPVRFPGQGSQRGFTIPLSLLMD